MSWDDIANLFGRNTTPSARITSAIVSILTLALIFFGSIKMEWLIYAYAFLGLHLFNHLYTGVDDLKIPTCPDCGMKLEYEKKIKKHKCKKKK